MLRNALWIAIVALAALALTGCKKESPKVPANPPTKTAEEYKAEADKQITAENLDAEMDKLEKEVDTEAGTEP